MYLNSTHVAEIIKVKKKYKTIQNHLQPFDTIWRHMKPYGGIGLSLISIVLYFLVYIVKKKVHVHS